MAAAAAAAGVGHVDLVHARRHARVHPARERRAARAAWAATSCPHFDGKGEANRAFTDRGVPTTLLYTSFYWDNLIHFGMEPQRGADGRSLRPADGRGKAARDRGRGHRPRAPSASSARARPRRQVGRHRGRAPHGRADGRAARRARSGEPVVHDALSPDEYRALGFPGADDLANMFAFKREFEHSYCASRSVACARELHPALMDFATWLARNARASPSAVAHAMNASRRPRCASLGPCVCGNAQRPRRCRCALERHRPRTRRDVVAFSPQYPLWSDGAAKRRWIRLPAGTAIDAAKPDAWEFPPGTQLWKEFAFERPSRDAPHRTARRTASWRFATYVWNAAGTDAELVPDDGVRALPVASAPNGRYAIPSRADCLACHDGPPVPVLGFRAVQLGDPTARPRRARGMVKNLPRVAARDRRHASRHPSDRHRAPALGYLHGNCGHCHNEAGARRRHRPRVRAARGRPRGERRRRTRAQTLFGR